MEEKERKPGIRKHSFKYSRSEARLVFWSFTSVLHDSQNKIALDFCREVCWGLLVVEGGDRGIAD